MRINFENDINATSAVNNQTQLHHSNKAAQTPEKNTDGSVFAISIGDGSGTPVASNNEKQTVEEWQENLKAGDVQQKRDYMSVMSLSMSDEDYAQMVATGQVPEDMDVSDTVTILDEIKAAVVRGGTQVSGYTDSVDKEVLAEITGSEAAANELINSMNMQDVPVNDESVKAAADAVNMASQVIPPSENAIQYLMENKKAPTVQNIYEASHSDPGYSNSGRDFASQIEDYARLNFDAAGSDKYSELMPQIEAVIEESGLEINDDTRTEAMWLIDKGIGLTKETLLELDKLNSIHQDNIINAVSIAMGAGIAPEKANLTYKDSIYTMAEEYYEKYMSKEADEYDIKQRRMLEEIRLTMSVEANRLLLRSNFQIDIAPMEKLIEALKLAEETINSHRFPSDDPAVSAGKAEEYKQVREELSEIPSLPAAILGETGNSGELRFANIRTYSLHDVYESGVSRRDTYAKAEERYEALMTAPRADLGDSIRKAFRNVDDILKDLGLDITEENRRSVRILGYNSMEINAESVATVKQADENLRSTISRLTPDRVLQMIREDVNPLKMTVSELGEYLNNQDDEPERKAASYARFLMQLERQDEISELEKESYIGIYRMLSSLDKNDDAAIGAIINSGMEFSFANMLSAMRSAAKSHMDYKVSDSFGGVDSKMSTPAIDDQINAAFSDKAIKEVTADPEVIAEMLQESVAVTDREIESMLNAGLNVSLTNVEVSELFKKRKGDWFDTVKNLEGEDELESAIEDTLEGFVDSDSAVSAYDSLLAGMKNRLSDAVLGCNTYIDVKAIQSSMRQISFLQKQVQNENYEFPAEIEGETTSIRLQIRHMTGAGEVTVTMQTEAFGKIAAQFSMGAGKSGFIAFEKAEGQELADKLAESMENELSFVPNRIHAPNLSLDKFTDEAMAKEKSSKMIKEEAKASDINNTELYRIARMFIGKVRNLK